MHRRLIFLACLLPLFCAACAGKSHAPLEDAEGRLRGEVVDVRDPSGPIPAPRIPPELAQAASRDASGSNEASGQAYAYTVTSEIRRPGAESSDASPGGGRGRRARDPGEEALLAEFTNNSVLHRLQDRPPETRTGLERRLSVALGEGRDILRSQGYYSGRLWGEILPPGQSSGGTRGEASGSAVVHIVFVPGQRYVIGKSAVNASLPAMEGKDAQEARSRLPQSLGDAGLPEGSPADAEDVLAAVERIKNGFLRNGFPFAEIAATRYFVDHEQKTLEAEITVRPGPFVRMGPLLLEGRPSVRPAYFEALRTWRQGRVWDQDAIERLRESLRQSGLFQSIEIAPADEDAGGARPVRLTLSPASERTVSGAIKYHTDFGPGVQAAWQHRNLTGRADSLRLSAPLWMDMQEVTAAYRLPFFLRRDQDFIASGGFLNQDTDAFRLTSAAASAGLQRRLSPHWTGSIQGSVQGGVVREPLETSRDYILYGLPVTLVHDSTDSLLNASRGQRLILAAAPYNGEYDGDFSVLRGRMEGQIFTPLTQNEELRLALRGVIGAVAGEHSDQLPPSIRFYSGGGGSVRGYAFQSIGPRNKNNDPLGGGSLLEVSTELRWHFAPEWGVVAFVDGGTAYKDVFNDPGRQLRWGAGLGLRYYTVVGPVRLDVATPLNARDDDDPIQLYISIGQSF